MSTILRCDNCSSEILRETGHNAWLKLFYFIEFLHNEGDITDATCEDLLEALMCFKCAALDEDDRNVAFEKAEKQASKEFYGAAVRMIRAHDERLEQENKKDLTNDET